MNPGGSDLVITVGGDLTPLETALNQIPQVAEQAFGQVQTAIQSVDWSGITTGAESANTALANVGDTSKTAETDLGNLATSVTDASDAAASAVGEVGDLADAASTLSDKASQVNSTLPETASDVKDVGDSAEQASGGLGDMAEQLLKFGEALAVTEGLKELGQEALTTFGYVEKATISLTALTGSAEKANETIETLKGLAVSDALQFPALVAAAQKMTALRFSTEQVNAALKAAADGAAATGADFTTITESIDRMVLSGQVMARMLATLGLSASDLGKALGDASLSGTALSHAFSALDQAGRLEALTTAMSKFGGVAEQVAQGVSGQWQNLKTQFEFVMEGIGAALAPVISQLLSFAGTTIIPAIQAMVNWFNQLPTPIKDVAVGLALVAAAAAPLAVAVAGFGLAVSGLSAALPAITALGTGFMALATESVPVAVAAIGNVTVAISEGLVGALTAGEALLLSFAAAGVAVATAFVFYDQIKQLAANLTDLNAVMNAGIPGWKDFKDAIASVADAVGGAIVSSFHALLDVLGPVGSAIRSIGQYLPDFAGMWNDVKNAIAGIHWSDLIGPIGALNSALKAMAEAIELVTGKYPSMQAAGTSALNAVQSANDKLNDSLVRQAGGFEQIAPKQAAYVKAHQDAAEAVIAHVAAANALVAVTTTLGTVAGFVGPTIAMLAGAHNDAAKAATAQATSTGALGGTLETLAGTQVWTAAKSVTDLVGCMDDAATTTTTFTGTVKDAGNVTADWARSIGGLQTAGEDATGTISGLGDTAQTATPLVTGYATAANSAAAAQTSIASSAPSAAAGITAVATAASNSATTMGHASAAAKKLGTDMGSAAEEAKSLAQQIADMDAKAVDAFDSLNGATMSVALGANALVSQRMPSWYGSEGALGNSMPLLPGQQPYNTTQTIVNSTATMTGFTPAVNAATTAITGLGTAATTSTAAVISNYNQFGQLTDAAGNVITALNPLTPAANAVTTAANSTGTALIGLGTAATTASAGFQDGTQALGAVNLGLGVTAGTLNQWNVAMSPIPGMAQSVYDALTTVGGSFTTVNGNLIDAGLSTDQLNAANQASSPVIRALTAAANNATTGVNALTKAAESAAGALGMINQPGTAGFNPTLPYISAPPSINGTWNPITAPGAGVGGFTNLAPGTTVGLPSIGSPTGSYVVPSGGANQGIGGPNSALNTGTYTSHPITLNVNLAGSVLTGANGMAQLTQQISAAMVNQLARMGIRMTRG